MLENGCQLPQNRQWQVYFDFYKRRSTKLHEPTRMFSDTSFNLVDRLARVSTMRQIDAETLTLSKIHEEIFSIFGRRPTNHHCLLVPALAGPVVSAMPPVWLPGACLYDFPYWNPL